MKEFDISTKIQEVRYDELSPQLAHLTEIAKKATYHSYAPYSKFKVGAAILLSDGNIVVGSNQENVAYPSGTCAERTACYYAHSAYPDATFEAIAIAARDTNGEYCDEPISPCGACRQALLQYEALAGQPVKVLLCGRDKIYIAPSIHSLLPLAFVSFK